MRSIYLRELGSYFKTMLGYVFLGIFLLMSGLFFALNNIMNNSASFIGVLSNETIVLILIIPLLTMRLFSEERKNKTDQLLLTAPVSIPAIVMGKFLAAFTVFLCAVAVTFIYPVILAILGDPGFMEIFMGYLGFILLGGALISVGLFISALTENQLTAAVFSMGVLLMLYMLALLSPIIGNPVLSMAAGALAVFTRFDVFRLGVLSVSSLIYLLTFAFAFLFLTGRALEKRRYGRG